MGYFSDVLGTLRTSFKVGKATLSSSGVTTAKTFDLPDVAGQLLLGSGTNKVTVGTSPPGSPTTGDVWIDTN